MWPYSSRSARLPSHGERLQGAAASLEGPLRGRCSAGAAVTMESPAGVMGKARSPAAPTGARPCIRQPMLASSINTQAALAGLFLLLFPLLAALPPSFTGQTDGAFPSTASDACVRLVRAVALQRPVTPQSYGAFGGGGERCSAVFQHSFPG